VVAELKLPYNLMVCGAVACAFQPTELLARRWRDLDVIAKTFVIRQTVYRGEIRNFTNTTEADEMGVRDFKVRVRPVWPPNSPRICR
jgi:hypothetical protein